MATQEILTTLQKRLEKGIKIHDIPGASMAVFYDDKVYTAAAGVLNIETGVGVTNRSIFQIGSITKLFTTTLIMQLVDEGKIELDEPVKKYLPTFQVADMDATQKITVRQLLCHTSGMDGDFFPEADYGREKLARYLEKCTLLPQLHPAGEYISYCNSGFCIAGRLIEVSTGRTWEEAMCERIFEPLDMDHAVVRAEETLKFRTAIGHLPLPGKDRSENLTQMLTPMPYVNNAAAPAGSTTTMAVNDLVKFIKMHLSDGISTQGKQVLSKKSTKAMQVAQFDLPKYSPENALHMGLGWMLMDWDGKRVIGHDGGTLGQLAFLRTIPDEGMAVSLLTNGMNGGKLYREIFSDLMQKLADIEIPANPKPIEMSFDFKRYVGRYENVASWMEVIEMEGKLKGRGGSKIWTEAIVPEEKLCFSPVEKDHFLTTDEGGMPPAIISFIDKTETGLAQYAYTGGRMMKRIGMT